MKKKLGISVLLLSLFTYLYRQNLSADILTGHKNSVTCVAYSPDDKYIASASEDKTIRIWDQKDGKLIGLLSGHTEPVWTLSYSPDGKYIASGGDDTTVRIWRTSDWRCIKVLPGHSKYVLSVDYSPNSEYLASGSIDRSVIIWLTSRGLPIRNISQHQDPVVAISFSPTGKTVAAATGQIIKIWQIDTGECIKTLSGHTDQIKYLTYDPAGKRLASCAASSIKIWKTDTGDCLDTMTDHTDEIKSLSYSGNGNFLFSCGEDKTVKLWDTSSGNCIKTFDMSAEPNSVACSKDGKKFAAALANGQITTFKIDPEDLAYQFKNKKDDTFATAATTIKSVSAAATTKKTYTRTTSTTTRKTEISKAAQPKKPVSPAPQPAAEAYVASGPAAEPAQVPEKIIPIPVEQFTEETAEQKSTETIKLLGIYSVTINKKLAPLAVVLNLGIVLLLFVAGIISVILIMRTKWLTLPNQIKKHIASGELDRASELFISYKNGFLFFEKPDIKKLPPEVLFKLYSYQDMLYELLKMDFSEDYRVSFTKQLIAEKNYIKAYELAGKFPSQKLSAEETIAIYQAIDKLEDLKPENVPMKYFFEYINTLIKQGNRNEAYKIINKYKDFIFDGMTFGQETKLLLKGHTKSVPAIVFSPDGQTLASAGFDKTIKIWRINDGKCVKTIPDNSDWVYCLSFSKDGNYLLAGLGDGKIRIWTTSNYSCYKTIEAHKDSIMSAAFLDDSRTFVSGGADNIIKFWDIDDDDCRRRLKGHAGWVKTVAISGDDKFLVSGSADTTIKVWNMLSNESIMSLEGHVWGGINSVTFSPDNKFLVSAGDDKTIRIWHGTDFKPLQTLNDHTAEVMSVSFSNDSKYMISCSADKTIRIWQTPEFECIKTILAHNNSVLCAGFSSDGQHIAAGGIDPVIKVWELKTILSIDEETLAAAVEIYDKTERLLELSRIPAEKKLNPAVYSIIANMFYKKEKYEYAQNVLNEKNKKYPDLMTTTDYNLVAMLTKKLERNKNSGTNADENSIQQDSRQTGDADSAQATSPSSDYEEKFIQSLRDLGKTETDN
ncbi:MAG: WD domain, G-beta repeat [Elusimicrobia bacterium ADurb.Bin231]|nr:MAG: WD domain, G-beta repeat [Elusimicrobia bacterium ADurb.Bin231]